MYVYTTLYSMLVVFGVKLCQETTNLATAAPENNWCHSYKSPLACLDHWCFYNRNKCESPHRDCGATSMGIDGAFVVTDDGICYSGEDDKDYKVSEVIIEKNYGGGQTSKVLKEEVEIQDSFLTKVNVPERCKRQAPGLTTNFPAFASFTIDNTTTDTQEYCFQYAVPVKSNGKYAITGIFLAPSPEMGNQILTAKIDNFTEKNLNLARLGKDCQPVLVAFPMIKAANDSIVFNFCYRATEALNSKPFSLLNIAVLKLDNKAIFGRSFNPITWGWTFLKNLKYYFIR